jgi:hypothetical protein
LIAVGTPFGVIYDAVIARTRDFELELADAGTSHLILSRYLRPACVRFAACRQDLANRSAEVDGEFGVELTETEIEILVNEMIREYISTNYVCRFISKWIAKLHSSFTRKRVSNNSMNCWKPLRAFQATA